MTITHENAFTYLELQEYSFHNILVAFSEETKELSW